MRSLVLLTVALAFVGCAKKTAKFTGSSNDPASTQPPPVVDKGKRGDTGDVRDQNNTEQPGGEKRNWIGDARARRDADGNPLPVDAAKKPDWGAAKPPAGGWQ